MATSVHAGGKRTKTSVKTLENKYHWYTIYHYNDFFFQEVLSLFECYE